VSLILLSSLFFPQYSASFGLLYIIGRQMHSMAYFRTGMCCCCVCVCVNVSIYIYMHVCVCVYVVCWSNTHTRERNTRSMSHAFHVQKKFPIQKLTAKFSVLFHTFVAYVCMCVCVCWCVVLRAKTQPTKQTKTGHKAAKPASAIIDLSIYALFALSIAGGFMLLERFHLGLSVGLGLGLGLASMSYFAKYTT